MTELLQIRHLIKNVNYSCLSTSNSFPSERCWENEAESWCGWRSGVSRDELLRFGNYEM